MLPGSDPSCGGYRPGSCAEDLSPRYRRRVEAGRADSDSVERIDFRSVQDGGRVQVRSGWGGAGLVRPMKLLQV